MADCVNESDFEIEWYYSSNYCAIKKLKNNALKNIVIPKSFCSPLGISLVVGEIHENAFRRSDLETIELPCSIIFIGHSAFKSCPNLTSVKRTGFNKDVLELDVCAFAQCTALQFVNLGKIKFADKGQQFWGCSSLKKFPFHEVVDCKIPYMAFLYCPIAVAKFRKKMKFGDFAFTKLNKIYLYEDFTEELPDWFLDVLKNSKIYIKPNSKLLDLAYDGYDIQFL